jgi:hypothetical protein
LKAGVGRGAAAVGPAVVGVVDGDSVVGGAGAAVSAESGEGPAIVSLASLAVIVTTVITTRANAARTATTADPVRATPSPPREAPAVSGDQGT